MSQAKRAKLDNGVPSPAADLPLPPGGLHIDGSMLEGGGQILRNASALAAITGTAVKVDAIRAGRSNPGLRPQHLTGLQLISTLCGGTLLGGAVNSTAITLQPGPLRCGDAEGNTGTAGSCMLLAQAALPCLLMAAPREAADGPEEDALGHRSRLELRGGTDASMAPPVGYLQHVLLPTLQRCLGCAVTMTLQRRGFFPKGGGIVTLEVDSVDPGSCLPPISLTTRGEVTALHVHAFTAGRLKPAIGQRMASAAQQAIKSRLQTCGVAANTPVEVAVVHEPLDRAVGDGCGVTLVAETSGGCLLGACGLGERGVSAESVGQRAGDELMDAVASGACTDQWLQDQLVVFMALAQGRSEVVTGEPTLHTRTAIAVAEALTAARFSLSSGGSGTWTVACTGAGIQAGSCSVKGARPS